MSYEEPRVMRELHEIRAKRYEETRHMTAEERAKSTFFYLGINRSLCGWMGE